MSTTKTIVYKQGPPKVGMGAAGQFRLNEPRTIDAALADRLLAKKSLRFELVDSVKPTKVKE